MDIIGAVIKWAKNSVRCETFIAIGIPIYRVKRHYLALKKNRKKKK